MYFVLCIPYEDAGWPIRRSVWVAQPHEATSCGSNPQSDVLHHPTRMMRFLVAGCHWRVASANTEMTAGLPELAGGPD
jgi:hypothetical protein